MKQSRYLLSKSQYTRYTKCPKLYWLSRNNRSKLTGPTDLQQQFFSAGTELGVMARELFPGGETVPFNLSDMEGMAALTRKLLDAGARTLYEAAFISDDIFVAVDILQQRDGLWNIYEVKSSTGVKLAYIEDTTIQAYVLEKAGLSLSSVNIVRINKRYHRDGELDVEQLFKTTDVTDRVRFGLEQCPDNIVAMKALIQEKEPQHPLGAYCLSPHECPGRNYCWQTLAGIPEKSVFTLTGARQDWKFELYTSGLTNLSDVPLDKCTPFQQLQIKEELHIEKEPIREFLAALEYPVSHLDFESFQAAIPAYQNARPYMQTPFQYSLHIETDPATESPDYRLIHRDFLAESGSDPRRELVDKLLEDIPAEGTILTYNQKFEKSIIAKLAEAFPDTRERLLALNSRVADLMLPFQKRWYYHPEQNGSYSIKKVLPALVPEMREAYSSLPGVNNGSEASTAWPQLVKLENGDERDAMRLGLLAYCHLDTLAMVKILEVLRQN